VADGQRGATSGKQITRGFLVCAPDLVAAAREAGDARFDVLIACAFNYEAHTTEFNNLSRIPVLNLLPILFGFAIPARRPGSPEALAW
jgi:hypothetical protein